MLLLSFSEDHSPPYAYARTRAHMRRGEWYRKTDKSRNG